MHYGYGYDSCGYDPCYGYGYPAAPVAGYAAPAAGFGGGFALIVVLFILLIIIGASIYPR